MLAGVEFQLHERIGDGVADIPADADPNTTAPPDARVVKLGWIPPHAANGFGIWAIDGTTITALPWVLDEQLGKWLPMKSAGVAVTPAGPTVIVTAGLALAQNAKVFMQLTTNTGVKRVTWRYC